MLSIEHIQNDVVICIDENGKKVKLNKSELPVEINENDILTCENGVYQINKAETMRQKKKNHETLLKLDTISRRNLISQILNTAKTPVSASALAEKFHVSRQIIVGDVALLRASGCPVIATPRGYLIERKQKPDNEDFYTIACRHNGSEQLLQELYAIVDSGATVVDVIVEHPVFGQITGLLEISSRFDADRFAETLAANKAAPLSQITDGIHLHTIHCPDPERVDYIKKQLAALGILVSE